jgi:hypothetical protein
VGSSGSVYATHVGKGYEMVVWILMR